MNFFTATFCSCTSEISQHSLDIQDIHSNFATSKSGMQRNNQIRTQFLISYQKEWTPAIDKEMSQPCQHQCQQRRHHQQKLHQLLKRAQHVHVIQIPEVFHAVSEGTIKDLIHWQVQQ